MTGTDPLPVDDSSSADVVGASGSHDPEATSAADVDWLGELRAAAKQADRSLLEQLTTADASDGSDTPSDTPPGSPPARAPDEVTQASGSDVLEEVRRVRLHRDVAATGSTVSGAPGRAAPERPNDLPAEVGDGGRRTMDSVPTGRRWEPPRRLASIEPARNDVAIADSTPAGSRWRLVAAGVVGAVVAAIVVFLVVDDAPDAPDDTPADQSTVTDDEG